MITNGVTEKQRSKVSVNDEEHRRTQKAQREEKCAEQSEGLTARDQLYEDLSKQFFRIVRTCQEVRPEPRSERCELEISGSLGHWR